MRHRLIPLGFNKNIESLIKLFNIPVRTLLGNTDIEINVYPYITPIVDALPGTFSFFYANRDIKEWDAKTVLTSTKASIILTYFDMYNELVEWNIKNKLFILVDDPKSVFMKLLLELTEIIKNIKFIKPGNDCYVGPNVFIEEDSVVGHDVMFMGNNYIYGGSSIGNNVVVKPGTVIGGCGYGFLTKEGKHTILPHIGGVIIEDDVLIGANTCIDSGLLGNTVIKQGAKIDNLVHIAHNVVIGRNTMVIANAMVAGSVKVGDNSQISPSVSIRQQIIVGSDVVVGMHSCVTKNIPDNTLVYGVPAQVHGGSSNKKLEDNK